MPRAGLPKTLVVHHFDGDHANNDPRNLRAAHKDCHWAADDAEERGAESATRTGDSQRGVAVGPDPSTGADSWPFRAYGIGGPGAPGIADVLRSRLTVRESQDGGTFGPTKTKKVRTFSLPAYLRDILVEHVARHGDPSNPDAMMFGGLKGDCSCPTCSVTGHGREL